MAGESRHGPRVAHGGRAGRRAGGAGRGGRLVSGLVVVPTGVANLASILALCARLQRPARVAATAREIAGADHVILPGVGAFGAAMEALEAQGFAAALGERIRAGRPTLAVCVGMQVLCESSEESARARGLGVVPGRVRRLRGRPVPQLGWNRVAVPPGAGLLASGWAYFAHSYVLAEAPPGWRPALSDYGGRFVAAMECGPCLATQFHPELSSAWGAALVQRWLLGEAAPRSVSLAPGPARVRIIPCLDVRDGRVVKGVRFQGLRDAGDPCELAARYEREGADELVVLDVSATPEGRRTAAETVRAVRRRLAIPLTVGGGVRGVEDARRLLDAGADKVSVNTAAVKDPELLRAMAERFGRQCTVLSIDASRTGSGHEVRIASGAQRTGLDALEWAARGVALGAGEVLLTSWDQDGTREGYDIDLVAAVSARVPVPVVASGGASAPVHLAEAARRGANGLLAASIFHYREHSVASTKAYLKAQGIEVRQ